MNDFILSSVLRQIAFWLTSFAIAFAVRIRLDTRRALILSVISFVCALLSMPVFCSALNIAVVAGLALSTCAAIASAVSLSSGIHAILAQVRSANRLVVTTVLVAFVSFLLLLLNTHTNVFLPFGCN
jgi:hypothetical protein